MLLYPTRTILVTESASIKSRNKVRIPLPDRLAEFHFLEVPERPFAALKRKRLSNVVAIFFFQKPPLFISDDGRKLAKITNDQ